MSNNIDFTKSTINMNDFFPLFFVAFSFSFKKINWPTFTANK